MLTPKRIFFSLVLSVLTVVGAGHAAAQATFPENTTLVHAGVTTKARTLQWGLLHGYTDCTASGNIDCVDPTSLIDALRPESWRLSNFWNGTHRYVIRQADFPGRLGTMVYWIVQDSFDIWLNGGVFFSPVPVCVGPPDCVPNSNHVFATFEDLREAWRTFLIESMPNRPLIDWYEVFSEPEGAFIGVTPKQLGELLVMTHDMIRSVEPDAKIAAPAMSGYHGPTLQALLTLVQRTGIRLDAISWHEFGEPGATIAHAADLRQKCSPNCPEFHVTEYQGKEKDLIPGEQVAWLAALEQADIAVAHRACWDLPFGDASGPKVKTCWAGFGGLLGPDNQALQPGYFVHVAYQNLGSLRLQAEVQNPDAAVIASIAPAGDAVSLLVGARASAAPSNERVVLDVPTWTPHSSVDVDMTRIDNLGNVLQEDSYQPTSTALAVTVAHRQVVLPVFALLPGEAWLITVTPAIATSSQATGG